jgi:hypothetical protein
VILGDFASYMKILNLLYKRTSENIRDLAFDSKRSGVSLVTALYRMGARGVAWIFLLGISLTAGLAIVMFGNTEAIRSALLTPLVSGIFALWISVLWVLLVVTAADLPFALRLLTSLYSLFYLANPLLSILPINYLLVPTLAIFFFELLNPNSNMRKWHTRLIWSLALAQFPPHFPLNLFLSVILKAGIGFVIASLPFWRRLDNPRWLRWVLIVIGLALPYSFAWGKSSERLFTAIELMLPALWNLSVPLWLWLGANFVEEGGKLGRFIYGKASFLKSNPPILISIPILFVLIGLLAFPLFFPQIFNFLPEAFKMIYQLVQTTIQNLPPDAYLGGRTTAGLMLLVGALGLYLWRRRNSQNFGKHYLEVAVGTIAFVVMFWQYFFDALNLNIPNQWWPLFLLALSWFWEPLRAIRELVEETEDFLEWFCVLIVILATLVISLYLSNPVALIRDVTLWSILGAVVFGLPNLVFATLQSTRDSASAILPFRPFFLGYSLMLLTMSLLPLNTWLIPPLVFGLGSIVEWHKNIESRWERWNIIAWVGLGSVAFLEAPWILSLPILPLAEVGLNRLYDRGVLDFLEFDFFILASSILLAAIPIAWSGHPRLRWLGLGIGVFFLLVVCAIVMK